MNTDPISDYLTRIRNAQAVGHKVVEIPASNLKKEITKVLHDQGYIRKFKFVDEGPQGSIKIALKYDKATKRPAITKLERVSKPGLRKYSKVKAIPRVLNGLGITIVSTPNGVMTGKNAQAQNVGGEILCYIY
ncbi:MAG: 30S ribosomal protein S8 [Bacteroidota bacterium]